MGYLLPKEKRHQLEELQNPVLQVTEELSAMLSHEYLGTPATVISAKAVEACKLRGSFLRSIDDLNRQQGTPRDSVGIFSPIPSRHQVLSDMSRTDTGGSEGSEVRMLHNILELNLHIFVLSHDIM